MDRSLACPRQCEAAEGALQAPLGNPPTEPFVPADAEVRRLVARILTLRALAPPARLAQSEGLLLPRSPGHRVFYRTLHRDLAAAAKRAGCSGPVGPHRLRHSFATEMLRLGVSLPTLMRLLGHKDIRMTLRYVEVTQLDLQREFHTARWRAAPQHQVPVLSGPHGTSTDLPGLRQALAATRHLLEMYRRGLPDPKTQRQLQRLDRRLLNIPVQLDRLTAEK